MTAKDLIIGNHYKTPSDSIFEFIKLDDRGDIVMQSVRNCMKIQQGITVFFWWFAEDLEEVEKLPA